MTTFQLYSASTVDDPATSDSLPRSDVVLRCVFRATPGSASDGYRASSTAVTRAAENVTMHCDATKILVDHFGSNDGQTFPVSHARLSREPGSCEYKALAASDGVAIERSLFPDAPQCRGRRDGGHFVHQVGRRREPRVRKRPNLLTTED